MKKNYCGRKEGGGHGYLDVCGEHEYGEGTPLYQCKKCMKIDNDRLTAQVEELKGIVEAFERVTDLWLPINVAQEHNDEAVALHRLRSRYLELLTRIGEENE